ncbi:hypothetical protein [Domibacillus antri]|uniref:hypothetical protein n=1 Tax=Domibacillus antri TaxID=1714264 RepID=UPI000AC1A58F|nr:hypothetical protein [Domibacillus antri]
MVDSTIQQFFKVAEIVVWAVAVGSYTGIVFICGRAWEYASPTRKKSDEHK